MPKSANTICLCLAVSLATFFSTPGFADPPDIVGAEAHAAGDTYRFDVTLAHADTGWDDYADGWRIETEDGNVLGTRELLHPHVEEQPFTRSLSGVAVPPGTGTVYVRARDNQTGWSSERLALDLP